MARQWPPVSVWLLSAWLLTAPVTLLAALGTDELFFLLIVFGYGLASCPLVLCGRSLGFALALAQAVVTGGGAVVSVAAAVAVAATDGNWLGALAVAVLLPWPSGLAFLLWWPETRRWFDVWPPAETDGDHDR